MFLLPIFLLIVSCGHASTLEDIKAPAKYNVVGALIESDQAFFDSDYADPDLVKSLKAVKSLASKSPKKDRTIDVTGITARTRIASEAVVIDDILSPKAFDEKTFYTNLGYNKHYTYIWDIAGSKARHVCGQFKPTTAQPGNTFVVGLGQYSQKIFDDLDVLGENSQEIGEVMIHCASSGALITSKELKEDGLPSLTKKQYGLLDRLTYLITDIEVSRRIPRGQIKYGRETIRGVKLPYGTINAMALQLVANGCIDFNEFLLPNEAYGFFTGVGLEEERKVQGYVLPKMLSIVKKFSDFLADEDAAADIGFKAADSHRDKKTDALVLSKKGVAKLLKQVYGE